MARRKNLAGIAALAGLGMLMANKGKKSVDEDFRKRQMAADRDASDQKTSGDQEDMFIEPGSGPYGQKFDDELPSASAPNKTPAIKKLSVKPDATPAPKPAATRLKNPGTGNQRGPTAEELAAYEANRNVNFGNEGRQKPVGQTSVSANQIPGQSSKAPTGGERADSSETERNINAIATATGVGGAVATAYKAKKMYDASQKVKAAAEAAAKGREAVTNPLSWMAGPKNAGKFAGEVPSAGREAVTNPLAYMAGPKNMGKFKEEAPSVMDKAKAAAEKFANRFRKKPLDEADTTGGAIGYKRGGKVRGYASGGSVSSASSRADGIATKGKTRGKMY